MAAEKWAALRGYPELPFHGMHIDSILCYMAYYLPLREVVLADPIRVYHIDHLHGWTPEVAQTEAFSQRLREQGIPWISHEKLNKIATKMTKERTPAVFNDENWGLADENLAETVLDSSP